MFKLSSFSWICFAVSLALNVSRGVTLVNSALKNILKNNIQVSQKQACVKVFFFFNCVKNPWLIKLPFFGAVPVTH